MQTSKSNTVKLTIDPNNIPPLTAQERTEIEAVAVMPDEQIDYTDAPYRPDAVWVKVAELPGEKQQITLRLDADVLDFFRRAGKRYQTRINAVLRAYVEAHKAQARVRNAQ